MHKGVLGKARKVAKRRKCELTEVKEGKGFQKPNERPQYINIAEVHEMRPKIDSCSLSNRLGFLVGIV